MAGDFPPGRAVKPAVIMGVTDYETCVLGWSPQSTGSITYHRGGSRTQEDAFPGEGRFPKVQLIALPGFCNILLDGQGSSESLP